MLYKHLLNRKKETKRHDILIPEKLCFCLDTRIYGSDNIIKHLYSYILYLTLL